MKHSIILMLLVLIFIQNVGAQGKVIKNDMPEWRKQWIEALGLTDLTKLSIEFSFRFENQGQVVEIFKDKGRLYGVLTNYTYHNTDTLHEMLSNKVQLDSVKVLRAYELIQQSGILTLPTNDEIKNWSTGKDGITYRIEQADSSVYQYKDYWSPTTCDSIPECLLVSNFVNVFSDTLNLSEEFKIFERSLPPVGCYNSGGLTSCYVTKVYEAYNLGYLGSGRLPLGFSASAYFRYIGKINVDLDLVTRCKFDLKGNYDLGFEIRKGFRLFKVYSRILYNYRVRKLDFVDRMQVIYNHQLHYSIPIRNSWGASFGGEYMLDGKEKIGGVLGLSKRFSKPSIELSAIASIFEDDINYRVGISKRFYISRSFWLRRFSVELFFEKFKNYNDLNLSFKIPIVEKVL